MLDKLDVEDVSKDAEVWEKVVRKLQTGAMPPAGAPRPDQADYLSLTSHLESELDSAWTANPNPGRAVAHRLNRAEYANVIRDLLSIEVDDESLLPPDIAGHGFDNNAEVLSVSPLLLERYMSAAENISRLAIGDSTIDPSFQTYKVPARLMQDERMSEELPFGSRGGIVVLHHFPLDGEYVIRIRLQRNNIDYIRGLAEPHQLDVRLDDERIKLFTVGGEDKGRSGPLFTFTAPDSRGDPEREAYETLADIGLEVRIPVKAGPRRVGITFLQQTTKREGVFMPRLLLPELPSYKGGDPAVDSVTIGGPFDATGVGDTPSRQKIFVCRPTDLTDDEPCAKKILSALARRAYRRPVTEADIQTLLVFHRAGRNEGGFETGIGRAIQRMLVSPEFLFRIERDPANVAPGTAHRISDLELASRLSFFLWSSIPDDELLDLAEKDSLHDRAVLETQVRRMLADSRATAIASNFAGQWLYLRNLQAVTPDEKVFPEFDNNLRNAFRQETELLFENMLQEDRSALDLLRADYTFVNERLARHYGIPNVFGSHFRRVKLSDENRRGLLGQGSILTVTSYANRTSPVLRGKWVLENILGTPPPAPPPNVPALPENENDGKVLSVRQRLEAHRANAVCASCHSRMDPLGFALENFDATGNWRVTENSTSIDASGILADGTKFQGPVELRNLLLNKPDQFVTTVTEKLLAYALGRGIEYYDAPAVRRIMRDAAPNDHSWSSIILGIVNSTPFQMRRSQEL